MNVLHIYVLKMNLYVSGLDGPQSKFSLKNTKQSTAHGPARPESAEDFFETPNKHEMKK